MMDNLEYIDRFFKEELSPDEKVQFEQRIKNDPAFAEEVAFYASALQTIKNDLAEEKKKRFMEIYQLGNHKVVPINPVRNIWHYVAAAAVVVGIIIGSYLIFFNTPASSPQRLADTYINEQLQTIGVKMSSKEDSLQKGKSLYNEGNLTEALQQFESIVRSDTSNTEAIKLAGLSNLRLQQYDKAMTYFEQLENYPGLYANPGKFYRALTLLKRNQSGDAETARQLLEQVVKGDLDKKEIAEGWLKKW